MDSSIGQAARDQAQAFKDAVKVGSVIITKLDGHAKGGGALSAVAATASPIIFIGTGEHIDDFETFNAKSFVSRLLGMGDITGLLNLFEEEKLLDQPELYKKITEGTGDFTFRDMYEQFQNLMKLGPLGKVMSMIPGLSQMVTPGKEKESVERIKRFMTIMDSFTAEELDSDMKIFNATPNRLIRIARGAGVQLRHVHEVLETYKPFKKVASGMGNLAQSQPTNREQSTMANHVKIMNVCAVCILRMCVWLHELTLFSLVCHFLLPVANPKSGLLNPKAMQGRGGQQTMQKLSQMINPQMLQQMGGMGGVSRQI